LKAFWEGFTFTSFAEYLQKSKAFLHRIFFEKKAQTGNYFRKSSLVVSFFSSREQTFFQVELLRVFPEEKKSDWQKLNRHFRPPPTSKTYFLGFSELTEVSSGGTDEILPQRRKPNFLQFCWIIMEEGRKEDILGKRFLSCREGPSRSDWRIPQCHRQVGGATTFLKKGHHPSVSF
jgi:hypothetical protein